MMYRDIRAKLEERLGYKVHDVIWYGLEHGGYIDDYFAKEQDIEFLVKAVRDVGVQHTESTLTNRKPRRYELKPDERLEYLSKILAAEASRIPSVAKFRDELLNGQLLQSSDVPNWVQQASKEDGPPSVWYKVAIREDHAPRYADAFASARGLYAALSKLPEHDLNRLEAAVSLETLQYGPPTTTNPSLVPISHEGKLFRLKKIAEGLTSLYGWLEWEGVLFVLCGVVPSIPRARIRIPGPVHMELHPAPRIELELDPRLSKNEVSDIYAKARNQVFKGRDRKMDKKNLELALFLVKNPGHTWRELQELWNDYAAKIDPEWRYGKGRANFDRDARAAYKRVRGKKWVHKVPNDKLKKG